MSRGPFHTSRLCLCTDTACMDLSALLAVTSAGLDGFLVGLLVGGGFGLLTGPATRSWLAYREWERASREADLADRLLERMEADAHRFEEPTDRDRTAAETAWRPQP
jgi:hypothetical protein